MYSIITLTTDFGTRDAYVGAMKGVILGINPAATIVDISHEIEPQNIPQAAYVLESVYRYFPEGTIHLAVVDPGVGSDRRAIIVRTAGAFFVAPDNGVLSRVAGDMLEAINITNPRFWLQPVSRTFHGRDIMAPVAAHLSLGTAPDEFGDTISSIVMLPHHRPEIKPDGSLIGHIVHADRFGNLVTDVKESDLPGKDIKIEVKGHTIRGLSSTYAEGDGLLALIGSHGYLEIAVKNGSAAGFMGADTGNTVRVRAISR